MNINPLDIMKHMGNFQEKLAAISAQGSSGGGMVEIELNGKFELTSITIAPEVFEAGDTEMLEDLITAAFSSALENVRESITRELGAMAGGLNIPGMMGMS